MQRIILILAAVLMSFPVQSYPQNETGKQSKSELKAQKKAEQQNTVIKSLTEKDFKIGISRIYPTESSSLQNLPTNNRYVSDGYYVQLCGDLFSCNLPYIGTSHTAVIGGQNLSLGAKDQKVEIKTDYNKTSDSYLFQFDYKNENMNDKWSCTIEVFTSGEANIRMQGISRDPISYRGEIQLPEQKKK